LAYIPDYTWIASVPAGAPADVLDLPGVTWAGAITADDKLDPAIRAGVWGPWNRASDGTVAVYVALHGDESLDTGRRLARRHGGEVTGEVVGINLLMVEMPEANLPALAAEEAVRWIEGAAPPLEGANDGSRPHINVDVVNASPYNLEGTNVDVLVYDSGQAGDHVDFGSRLTHGDSDTVSEHSTHVAGTVGGSGANSATKGGSAFQWRGMANAVDLISYGTSYGGSGYIFYQNVPDIEADWAAAQNTYGADLGTASLGSNIYANYYPGGCFMMGQYGSSSVLLDQIVRGGNSVVGIGDKYIATWAAGNERGWSSTCGGRSYDITAPPASAKNPIQVGGSNTNNTTQYAHTSWGPTQDGRIKPIVTAGACQTTGDYGITSTDNNPANDYTTKCGTSMATPAVAGGIALMLEHYRDVYNTTGRFWPSTAKAILIQTASDEGRPGPDYQWGFGLVDIHAAVDLISRRAFRETSIDQGEVDVYSFIVPDDGDPATVSIAWDDIEASFEADPTLINDLDLELVSPSGAVWRPWVLDENNPTNNATRGVNGVDNQEQVQVPSPEVGRWIVRVSGTTVPQGPQDYSLVCEGCKPLNVGVCQDRVSGATLMTASPDGGPSDDPEAAPVPAPEALDAAPTEGELWQQALEARVQAQTAAQDDDPAAEIEAAMVALETARQAGPEAVVALLDTLRGPALDMALDDIQAAQEMLAEAAPPPPETGPVSAEEEAAAVQEQIALDAQTRARALAALTTDPAEGQLEGTPQIQKATPNAPRADLTVGSGCTYATIAAAITAATPGDRLLIEGGVTFNENIVVNKDLTLEGGYNGCASGSSNQTIIDGGGSGRVADIQQELDVTLENLILTNGSSGAEGGGIRFAVSTGTGDLTLNNVNIHGNTSTWGGGLWVGPDAQVTGYDVHIYDNTASAYGGGVRLFGGRAALENSSVHDNSAPSGGGVYASQENGYNPALILPVSTDLYDNQALTGDGFGGGLYLRQGTAYLDDCADIYSNDAIEGGGAYLITSTLTIVDSCSEISYNSATGNGGGVYALGSNLNLAEDAELEFNDAGTDGSGSGGGAYLDNSDLYSDKASVNNNETDDFGGGAYLINNSRFDMDLGGYTCLGPRCSRLSHNLASNGYGGGIYVNNSRAWLDNTFIENNRGTLGGGVYAYQSDVYANSSLFARNNATNGTGDGARLYTGSSMTGQENTFAYNDTGGAATGEALALSSANLTLGCSIVWGHTTSIDDPNENVTYSDVQWGYDGEGNLNVNPQFVAPASQDYHLQSSSPVIDRCRSGFNPDFDAEVRPIVLRTDASPYDMGADEAASPRVGLSGSACEYGTLQQAVNAADAGDTIYVASGVYFENVNVTKPITIVGGYNSTCSSPTGGDTRIEGRAGSGSVFDMYYDIITLRDLDIAWGDGYGGGIETASNAQVTLDNVDVYNNHGGYGGGAYISGGTVLTLTNGSEVRDNTASIHGGGARVWGKLVSLDTSSDISYNCAPHGGGASVPGGELHLYAGDMESNEAADPTGQGGGIHAGAGGHVTMQANAWVYRSTAYDGAGIYADGATVDLSYGVTADNDATNYGGGIMLINGATLLGGGIARVGYDSSAYINTAPYGAGIFADGSTVDFQGYIVHNEATYAGGGIYATDSTLHLTNAQVGGVEEYEPNAIVSGNFAPGMYLSNGTHATLDNTRVVSNTFQTTSWTYGGGAYLNNGSFLTMTNGSSIEQHTGSLDPDSRGGGIYASASTVTLDGSHVLSNTSAIGGGVRLWNNCTLNILNGSEIRNNRATDDQGGGIAAGNGAMDINVTDATFQYNVAAGDGGAIFINEGTLDFTGWWDLRWNSAGGNGGAVALHGTANAAFYASGGSSMLGVNSAGGHGGALYTTNNNTVQLHAVAGHLIHFNTNNAQGHGGGGYANGGALFDVYGRVEASSNWAGGNGGVFYLDGSSAWFDDYGNDRPAILVNRADNGGAVYAVNSPWIQCDGAMFGAPTVGNTAQTGDGGAFFLSGSTFIAENCVFQSGTAEGHGGAIAAYTSTLNIGANQVTLAAPKRPNEPPDITATGCDPSVEECSSFRNNTADDDSSNAGNGGGIYANDSTLNVAHTHFHHNTGVRGGAVHQTGSNAIAEIRDTLIYSNTSTTGFGAGIRTQGGAFTVTHVTLAHNENGAGYSQSNTTGYAANSIASGNELGGFWLTGGTLTGTCNIDQSGNVGPDLNPEFVDPGAGEDYHLRGNSPAIDRCATGLSPDLDDVTRPVGDDYDAGAYEYPFVIEFAPDRTGSGLPGELVAYTHTLTNAGGVADTYTLTVSSNLGWDVDVGPEQVALNGGQSATVFVSVTVPTGEMSGTMDIATVEATSSLDPDLSAQVVDTTTVGFAPGAAFAPDHVTLGATESSTYLYTHWLTNTGNAADTFNLSFSSSQGWGSLVTAGPFNLAMGASTLVTVSVTVPGGGTGQSDTSIVTATSAGGAGPVAVQDITSAFTPDVDFTPDHAETVEHDTIMTYTHSLTNAGDATDTFNLAWSSTAGWGDLLDPGPFTLNIGESQEVRVRVTVPAGAAGMQDTTYVTATSTGGAGPKSVEDTTTVYAAGLAFAPNYSELVEPGDAFTYTHTLTNTGAAVDTFDLSLTSSEGWATLLDPGPITLNAGATAQVRLRVDVPPATGGITDTSSIIASSRAGALSGLFDSVADATTAVLEAGVTLMPNYTEMLDPGTTMVYTHTLRNNGTATDTFDLAFSSSEGWGTLLTSSPLTLAAGADTEVYVQVDVPTGSGGQTDVSTVEAISQLTPSETARVTDTTSSRYTAGTALAPDHAQSVTPDTILTYTHWLTNTGTGPDIFDLQFTSDHGWGMLLDAGPFSLDAGESISIHVRVDVPAGSGGMMDTTYVTATSQTGGVSDSATDTTTSIHTPDVVIEPDQTRSVLPDESHTYIHTLRNAGDGEDTFDLTFSSSQGWATLLDPGPFTLDAGDTTEVRVEVVVPSGLISGTLTDVAVVTATSQADTDVFDTATDTTDVGYAPDVTFVPDYLETGAAPNDTFVYTHTLTNAGNYTDTFELTFSSSQGWGSLLDPGPFNLGPMEATEVRVEVTVPAGGTDQSDTSVVTATSQGGAGPALVRDTTAAFDPGVAFTPDHIQTVDPGETITYTHYLTNTGSATDTLTLSMNSSQGWATLLDPGPFMLVPNAGTMVRVRVMVPAQSGGQTDVTVIEAATLSGGGPTAQVTDTTTASYAAGVALTPDHAETVPAGSAIVYTHHLTNTGNGPDTFSMTLTSSQGWATLLTPGPFDLAAGDSTNVQVEVAVPTDTLPLVQDVTTLTAMASLGGVSDSAIDTTTAACDPLVGGNFTYRPLSPQVGQNVMFTGTVAGGSQPITYTWTFDDGSGTGTGRTIAHAFATTGTFTVMMTATNVCPSVVTATHDVDISSEPDIAVDPLALHATLNPDSTAHRTLDIDNNGALDLTWVLTESPTVDWLDASPTSGLIAADGSTSVDVTFDTAGMSDGVYTTTLQVTSNDPDEPQVDVSVTLTVTSACIPVAGADFTFTPTAPEINQTVSFTGTIGNGTLPITYTWAFGDGTFGSGQTVDHTYTLSDTYTVVMTATNGCPSVDVVTHDVTAISVEAGVTIYLPVMMRDYDN
jgi:uncharacterized membrane protein